MPRYAGRLAVAALVAAAVGAGVPAPPAQASTCGSASGVTVVVDFHQLGGGVQTFCDLAGAGTKSADAQLRAGHQLVYVQRQPEFICRIDAKPASDPCVNTPPADAYWSLWWSDGKSGKWKYSSTSAGSLTVPAGGYVGMSWQDGTAQVLPGIPPRPHAAKPSSSPSPHPTSSSHPSTGPGQAPGSSDPAATGSPFGSSAALPKSSAGHGKKRLDPSKAGHGPGKASHGPDQTQAGAPPDQVTARGDSADTGGSGGLPGWVAPVAVTVLFLGAGAIALLRRKSSGGA